LFTIDRYIYISLLLTHLLLPANSVMKIAQVTPLLKKLGTDVSDLNNFRPTSNLSTVSKILEKLLIRLNPFISNSLNYCSFQSADRSRHSTETALVKLTEDLLSAVDTGSITAVARLDFSTAFDTMSHTKLYNILINDFSITDSAL